MGFYLEAKDGSPKFKADLLIKETGCGEWEGDPNLLDFHALRVRKIVPIVVISNFLFDAAGIAYSEREYREFTDPRDHRPKRILLMQEEDVLARCPYVKEML